MNKLRHINDKGFIKIYVALTFWSFFCFKKLNELDFFKYLKKEP